MKPLALIEMTGTDLLRMAEQVVLDLDDYTCRAIVLDGHRPLICGPADAVYAAAVTRNGVVGTYRKPITSHQVLEDLSCMQDELRRAD